MSALLASTLLAIPACSWQALFPASARDALMAHWDSLPTDPGLENRIIRAWRGKVPDDSDSGARLGEVWCVEAEVSSPGDPSVDGQRLVWIVIRDTEQARWTAAMLATMSSSWPYESCGEAP